MREKMIHLTAVARQFVKFGAVGLSNTLVSSGITYIFIFISPGLIYWGQSVGFLLSVLNAYYWNSRFVFKRAEKISRGQRAKEIARVYLSYGATFLLGLGLTWVMRNKMSVSDWLIPLVLVCICTPVNFVTNKLWAFRGKKGK